MVPALKRYLKIKELQVVLYYQPLPKNSLQEQNNKFVDHSFYRIDQ